MSKYFYTLGHVTDYVETEDFDAVKKALEECLAYQITLSKLIRHLSIKARSASPTDKTYYQRMIDKKYEQIDAVWAHVRELSSIANQLSLGGATWREEPGDDD